jgi:putative flippase GtrA
MNAITMPPADATAKRLQRKSGPDRSRRMHALLLRLSHHLPDPARSLATEARLRALVQFMMFGVVGFIGFFVDTAIVYGLRWRLGLIGAGMVSYLVAATVTWLLNRLWTFRGSGSGPVHRQWALFLVANLLGFTLNRGTYALLVTFVPICAEQPVFAVFAGAVAGMFCNFRLSKSFVFR